MLIQKCASFLLSTFFLAPLTLACEAPTAPTIPNGANATEQEMADAGEHFHQFMIDSQVYQTCLEEEAREARRRFPDDDREEPRALEDTFSQRHNAASAAMRAAAQELERAIEVFEKRR